MSYATLSINVMKLNDSTEPIIGAEGTIPDNNLDISNITPGRNSYRDAVAATQVVTVPPTGVMDPCPTSTPPQLIVTPPTDEEDNGSTSNVTNDSTGNISQPHSRPRHQSGRNVPQQRPPPLSGQRWGPPGPARQYRSRRHSASRRPSGSSFRDRDGSHRTDSGSADQPDNDWTLVDNRRRSRGIRHRPTSVPGLQGAPLRTSRVFISRVERGDINSINTFLAKNHIDVIENVKVSHNDAPNSSFRVTLSIPDRNKVLHNIIWPRGIQCKLWHNPRPREDEEIDEDTIGHPQDGEDNDSEETGASTAPQA